MKKALLVCLSISIVNITVFSNVEATGIWNKMKNSARQLGNKISGKQDDQNTQTLQKNIDLCNQLLSSIKTLSTALDRTTFIEAKTENDTTVLSSVIIVVNNLSFFLSNWTKYLNEIKTNIALLNGQQAKETERAQTKADTAKMTAANTLKNFIHGIHSHIYNLISSIIINTAELGIATENTILPNELKKISDTLSQIINILSLINSSLDNNIFANTLNQCASSCEYTEERSEEYINQISTESVNLFKYLLEIFKHFQLYIDNRPLNSENIQQLKNDILQTFAKQSINDSSNNANEDVNNNDEQNDRNNNDRYNRTSRGNTYDDQDMRDDDRDNNGQYNRTSRGNAYDDDQSMRDDDRDNNDRYNRTSRGNAYDDDQSMRDDDRDNNDQYNRNSRANNYDDVQNMRNDDRNNNDRYNRNARGNTYDDDQDMRDNNRNNNIRYNRNSRANNYDNDQNMRDNNRNNIRSRTNN